MKQIPATELDNFKRLYFADFFCFFSNIDLKNYFYPFWKDEYCIQPEYKIGHWLWRQYKEISYSIDVDKTEGFTNLLFDRFSGDEKFINFLYEYKRYYERWRGLKGDALYEFYDGYQEKSVAIYTASAFRLNQEEVFRHFCFWLKKEGVLAQVDISGETEKQKEICKIYVNHYFNRLPISSLPKSKFMAWNEWFTSIGNFFKGG